MKMDLPAIAKLDRPKSINAFKIVTNASKPVFSGSLDHRINMLDIKKVLNVLEMGTEL